MRVNTLDGVGTVSRWMARRSRPKDGGSGGEADGNHSEGAIGSGMGNGGAGDAVTETAPVRDRRIRICPRLVREVRW